MKRALAAIAVVLACAAPAAASSSSPSSRSAPSTAQQVTDLARTVKTLQAQVKALQAKTRTLQRQVNRATSEVSANYTGDACDVGLVADAFQATWNAINQLAGHEVITVGGQLSDKSGCTRIEVARGQPSGAPTVSIFNALINWIL
jgi:hypothetical protein